MKNKILVNKHPQKLSYILTVYFFLSSFIFVGGLLIWTYFSTIEIVNSEIEKSFNQRKRIAEEFLLREANDIGHTIHEILLNKENLTSFLTKKRSIAQKDFVQYIDDNIYHKFDVMFITTPDQKVWLNASRVIPNVEPILPDISKNSRKFLNEVKIETFENKQINFTGMFRSKKIVLENGEVAGILVIGLILDENLQLMGQIKKKTNSEVVYLENDDKKIIASSSKDVNLLMNIENQPIDGDKKFKEISKYSLLTSKCNISLADDKSNINIVFAIGDSVLNDLQQRYMNSLYIIIAGFILFLFMSLFLIRQLISPSIKSLLSYTDKVSKGDTDIKFEHCSISELNTVGSAMNKMVNSIHKSQIELIRLSTAIKQSPTIIAITDLEANIEYVNPKFSQLTGYTPEEVIGKSVKFLSSGELSDKIYDELWETISNGNEWHGEFHNVKKDGRLFWESASVSPIFDNNGKMINYLKVAEDITDKKKNEEELQKMQKLKSVGILAGGIAHDFNNILTGIFGNISLAKIKISENNEIYRYLNEAEKSIKRATKLTKQLLTFSKGGSPVKELVEITKTVTEVVKFDLSGSSVKPVFSYPKDLWNAEIDKGQIGQVFSNLTINANQASPDGGHLFITMKNVSIIDSEIVGLKQGKYIKVSVQDEGTGIDEENCKRIFDPYFTTKQSGNGLGLATSYSIIKKHNGHIEVSSKIGKGTTFIVYLPASNSESIGKSNKTEYKSKITHKSAKILIMDDEEMICNIAVEMIKEIGFSAEVAKDGVEAIKIYKNSFLVGKPFDAVIMDLTIPGGMGGKETIKQILEIDPKAKVIVSSGYSDDDGFTSYLDYGFKDTLEKPYTANDMRKKLNNVLNG